MDGKDATPGPAPLEAADGQAGHPPPATDEVTLADLVDAIRRRRRVALWVAGLVLVATIAFTAGQDEVYEASATAVPVHETAAIVDLLESSAYASEIRNETGIRGSVDVVLPPGERKAQATLLTIRASAPTADEAARLANAYVDGVQTHREVLDAVVEERNWQKYYEQAGKNTTVARQQLDGLLAGLSFVEPVDPAAVPVGPASPDWRLNLALGGVLAVMLALFAVFAVEAGHRVRRDLASRRLRADP